MLVPIADNAIVRFRPRPVTRPGYADDEQRAFAMQRLTELYESRRYGHSMARPRLSALAGSPIPMLPSPVTRTASQAAMLQDWKGYRRSAGIHVEVTHVIVI